MRRDWILAVLAVATFVGVGGWYVVDSRVPEPEPYVLTATIAPPEGEVGGVQTPDPSPRTLASLSYLARNSGSLNT